MAGFVGKNDQKPPAPETNASSSSSSSSSSSYSLGVAADVDNDSQPLRVKIWLQGREIVVSSDDKPPLDLKLEKDEAFMKKIAAAMAAATPETTTGTEATMAAATPETTTGTATAIVHRNVDSVVRQRLIEARPHPTATANYGVAASNTENTLDDTRRLLQSDSRSLSLNQGRVPVKIFGVEINAPDDGELNAHLQQQEYKPEEFFHGENFRADGGLLCPQPLHGFPPHSFDDENATTSRPDDDNTDYASSYGGYGTQPQ